MTDETNKPNGFELLLNFLEPSRDRIINSIAGYSKDGHIRWMTANLIRAALLLFIVASIFWFAWFLIDMGEVAIGVGILTHAAAVFVGVFMSSSFTSSSMKSSANE